MYVPKISMFVGSLEGLATNQPTSYPLTLSVKKGFDVAMTIEGIESYNFKAMRSFRNHLIYWSHYIESRCPVTPTA